MPRDFPEHRRDADAYIIYYRGFEFVASASAIFTDLPHEKTAI